MSKPEPVTAASGGSSRYGFAALFFASLLSLSQVLRLVLLFRFGSISSVTFGDVARMLLTGLERDVFISLVFSLPLLFWFWLVPERWFQAWWHRLFFTSVIVVFWMVQIFLTFAEYYFFEEFRSRFNTVAVDYLLYPHEVFINIWDSYPVAWVVGICGGLALAWLAVALRSFRGMWARPIRPLFKLGFLLVVAAAAFVLSRTITLKEIHVTHDRTLNELANNGALSFAAAFWTRNLDYTEFYRTLPHAEAWERTRRLLADSNSRWSESNADSIRRQVAGDSDRPRLNVVILLEESLGSEFWGSLGRKEATLTPEMDRLAAQEGMLFTNLYASGNRTVRGFEGVLASFPPLPGDSIVKRDLSDNVETIARVLKRDGYSTLFLYGGRGVFDGMRSFAVNNGYDRFIEQKHFDHPTFTTIWGVCDEDLYARAIQEFRNLSQAGKPFLGTVLSVSNHKPYTYPKGRIAEDPEQRRRNNAVKYADYSLGQFFKAARQEPFWTNTIFVVVADHGARVYGSQKIPIHSYEIPLLITGPAVVHEPSRPGQLGCSLDVSPTRLGLLGRPYETLFFGRDLLHAAPEAGRVLINHNRDIGIFAQNRLGVLGLRKTLEFYEGDPKREELRSLPNPTAADEEIAQDGIALFQVADELYTHRQYRIDGATKTKAETIVRK